MKSGKRSAILWKQDLMVNQSTLKKYLKTKIKANEGKINTYFHDKEIPNVHCICLSLILIDSVYKMSKNYYLQAQI